MTELKVLDEKPVNFTDLKEMLAKLDKDKELSYRGEKTKEYLSNFTPLTAKEAQGFSKKIEGLDIPRLKDRHITKIMDVLPKDLDSLKALFSGETITIKDEDLKRILDVIPN
ncbi:hypothetical protein HOC80_02265 [archaeon]|jgi:DNA-directed RNA polymerase subunit F|nr:hypothetical protein [archaeon]MBT4416904.1 hypothetical protein [archaeon]